MFTLEAFVCDNEEIRDILSQVLIANDQHVRKSKHTAVLRAQSGTNLVLWTAPQA